MIKCRMLIFRQCLACSVNMVSWQFPLWWWALSGGTVCRWPVVLYFHPNHILRNRHEVGLFKVNWEVWLPTYRETALCSHTGKTWAMPPLQTVIPKSSIARSLFCGAAQRWEKADYSYTKLSSGMLLLQSQPWSTWIDCSSFCHNYSYAYNWSGKETKSLGENTPLFAQIDVFWLQAHSTKMD